ncbi:hypothetical protein ACFPK9_12065 [Rubritalea spongiae]|uniref:Zinc-regulated TonB-dependent outer membrane receptor n=1 Tax=Rubritalea spongiae TaxID=430797 RepID=A0ABW5E0F9_9BACT
MKKTLAFFPLLTSAALAAPDFELNLNAHVNATVGQASIDEALLATHAHDPNDEFTLQGIELSASATLGEYLAGFVAYNGFLDDEDKLDGELEEAFLKFQNIPGGFEVRAGRLLNRVTTQNDQHLHSWHFVDANLITTRFLGDEGLISESGELSYKLPFQHDSLISVAFGNVPPHDHAHHDHGHDEEHHDDHDDHDDHHDDHDDHSDDHDEHLEGEEALLADNVLTFRWKGIYYHTDFQSYTYGASFLTGDNGFQERTNIYGADLTYLWRENGLEAGGKHLRATGELIYRDFDYRSEDGDVQGSADEWGVHTGLGWGFIEDWELGARYGYLQGVGEAIEGLPERHRASLALTRAVTINEYVAGHARLQYNHDWLEEYGHENSIWLQFQFDFGQGGEVR